MNETNTMQATFAGLLATTAILLAPLAASAESPNQPSPDPQVITVDVPVVPFEAKPDRFVIGLIPAQLNVLGSDSGTPVASSLCLVNPAGQEVPEYVHNDFVRLTATRGVVVAEPLDKLIKAFADKGIDAKVGYEVNFKYCARSANGPSKFADVKLIIRPVISAEDDAVSTAPGKGVTLDVVGNDIVNPTPTQRTCPPRIAATAAELLDDIPLVQSWWEKETDTGEPWGPCRTSSAVTVPGGVFTVTADGKVLFTPAAGFTGTATAFYEVRTVSPVDADVAKITVTVSGEAGGNADPKPDPSPPAAGGAGKDGGAGQGQPPAAGGQNAGGTSPKGGSGDAILGGSRGSELKNNSQTSLARTGFTVIAMLSAALLMVGVGVVARRRGALRGLRAAG